MDFKVKYKTNFRSILSNIKMYLNLQTFFSLYSLVNPLRPSSLFFNSPSQLQKSFRNYHLITKKTKKKQESSNVLAYEKQHHHHHVYPRLYELCSKQQPDWTQLQQKYSIEDKHVSDSVCFRQIFKQQIFLTWDYRAETTQSHIFYLGFFNGKIWRDLQLLIYNKFFPWFLCNCMVESKQKSTTHSFPPIFLFKGHDSDKLQVTCNAKKWQPCHVRYQWRPLNCRGYSWSPTYKKNAYDTNMSIMQNFFIITALRGTKSWIY